MATLGRKEFFETLNKLIGDNSSDEAITALENLTDTFNDFENRTSGSTDWEKRYNENDKMWREKYRARFFDSDAEKQPVPEPEPEPEKTPEQVKAETISIDDLFREDTYIVPIYQRNYAWKNDEINTYTTLVHSLKSSARTVGAMEVWELARKLENAGKTGDIALINTETPMLLEK